MAAISNSIKYPEAWTIFVEHARNVQDEPDLVVFGRYRIYVPWTGEWLYSNCPGNLFWKFKEEFYKPRLESPSVYGKIQYIVNNF